MKTWTLQLNDSCIQASTVLPIRGQQPKDIRATLCETALQVAHTSNWSWISLTSGLNAGTERRSAISAVRGSCPRGIASTASAGGAGPAVNSNAARPAHRPRAAVAAGCASLVSRLSSLQVVARLLVAWQCTERLGQRAASGNTPPRALLVSAGPGCFIAADGCSSCSVGGLVAACWLVVGVRANVTRASVHIRTTHSCLPDQGFVMIDLR